MPEGVFFNFFHQLMVVHLRSFGIWNTAYYDKIKLFLLQANKLWILFGFAVDTHKLVAFLLELPAHDIHREVMQFLFA